MSSSACVGIIVGVVALVGCSRGSSALGEAVDESPGSARPSGPIKPDDGCPKSGRATIETNAGIDSACARVLSRYLTFAVGSERGPHVTVMLMDAKTGRPVAGQQYVVDGGAKMVAMHYKEKAKALAGQPIFTATLSGVAVPDKAIVPLGTGTITYRKLPERDAKGPFEVVFDLTFRQYKVETVGGKANKRQTGPDFHVKGVVVGN